MRPLNSTEIEHYTHTPLTHTFSQRLQAILASDLDDLLPGNPYILPSANPRHAGDVVENVLRYHLLQAEADFVASRARGLAAFCTERGTDVGEIIFPEVKACRDALSCEEGCTLNRLTKQFIDRFCTPDGAIDWVKLVEFNSGNYDLDKFVPSA